MKVVQMLSMAVLCTTAPLCLVARAQNDVGNFYMGKVKVTVIKSYSGQAALPKADKVLIQDFSGPSEVVTMDESAAGRLHTLISLWRDPDGESTAAALAQQVQQSFSKSLINDLKKSDIDAQRSSEAGDATKGSFLIVTGEMTAIDEGNKVKRVMVGLGRGGSVVQSHITVSSVLNGHATVVLELNLKSESGKKLGALETMGGGSLAVSAGEGDIGDRRSSVQADASRMAKGVANQIQNLMVDQKWMTASVTIPAPAH